MIIWLNITEYDRCSSEIFPRIFQIEKKRWEFTKQNKKNIYHGSEKYNTKQELHRRTYLKTWGTKSKKDVSCAHKRQRSTPPNWGKSYVRHERLVKAGCWLSLASYICCLVVANDFSSNRRVWNVPPNPNASSDLYWNSNKGSRYLKEIWDHKHSLMCKKNNKKNSQIRCHTVKHWSRRTVAAVTPEPQPASGSTDKALIGLKIKPWCAETNCILSSSACSHMCSLKQGE